jgi:asparagine synthase (glutamine-hydrolysing)
MCGIAGIWHLNQDILTKSKLIKFTDSLKHRGPDGSGYFIDSLANLGLGHRRLSILDLSESGKQPMSFANERYWIIYNGEVFNFIELRDELKNKGYSFETETDTEVILASYHCWGLEALNKFNGMFGFAIWDKVERKLLLVRDRFGIKPLYYTYIPDKLFAFASETYAFKFLDDYNRKFNEKNILFQINAPNSLEGRGYTIFENIYQLLPGHYMIVEQNKPCRQKRWWNTLENLQEVPYIYQDQVEKFKELFISSLKLRLRSDVSIATALSGGIDSSSVFCTLNYIMKSNISKQRIPSNWQQAFIATFSETLTDEKVFAEEVINYTKLPANYIILDESKLIEKIIDTTVRSDSITGDPLIAANMVYESMKKSGISVSLDGHGPDEMLYGYPWLVKAVYNFYENENDIKNKLDIQQIYMDLFNIDVKDQVQVKIGKRNIFFYKLKKLLKKTSAYSLYHTIKKNFFVSTLPELSDKPYNTEKLNSAEKILFECFHISTLPTLLRNFDRASMQNGVEVRMPFMDWRLVTYVFSLPLSSKIGNGCTKRILRDAMNGIVPNSILKRKIKYGLMAPLYEWFNNKLSEWVIDEVNSSFFISSTIWNGKELSSFVTEKTKSKSWKLHESAKFWPIFNAYLLLKYNQ